MNRERGQIPEQDLDFSNCYWGDFASIRSLRLYIPLSLSAVVLSAAIVVGLAGPVRAPVPHSEPPRNGCFAGAFGTALSATYSQVSANIASTADAD
jgi:hypothetical protein